jgi:opacity protein-like surface antigen
MKKITFAALLFSLGVSAQNNYFYSVKAGASINNNEFGNSALYEPSGKVSFFAAASIEYKPNQFGVEAELQYTNAGSKGSVTVIDVADDIDTQLDLNTLNLVVTGKYYPSDYAALKAGFYAGGILDASYKYNNVDIDYKDYMKSVDFGLAFGLDFDITKNIFIDAKYLMGLTDIDDTDQPDTTIKNRFFQMGLGYRF